MKTETDTGRGPGKAPFHTERILIEASKLADRNTDGIRRYVLELLTALSRIEPGERPLVDVMVNDDICSLEEALSRMDRPPSSSAGDPARKSFARRLGVLVPPALLYPAKWLMPAAFCRRFLGKEKSQLQMPVFKKSAAGLAVLLLPPVLAGLIRSALPTRLTSFLWRRGLLRPAPKAVDPGPYDLVHHTLPNHWHHLPVSPVPTLVTVHDLCHIACPRYLTHGNATTLKMGIEQAVRGGARFISVSHSTRSQMIDAYGLDADRITTVHNACDQENFRRVDDAKTRRLTCDRYGIPPGPFLLTLSTIEPRKNLARTIKAFLLMLAGLEDEDIHLVIAGPQGWKNRNVHRAANGCDRVHFTGYVVNDDLAAIYSSATGFVYASHYEGFGLPLLEAMQCGLPVIYGDNSSMPEIVGDAGLPVGSRDTRAIAAQMKRIVTDRSLAERLGQRGQERAGRFSWDRAARETLAAYRQAIGTGQQP